MRFHGLQVLRFVAAFSVVLYHSGLYAEASLKYQSPLTQFLHHPAFGSTVFLFFTLSGFVIAHTLATVPPGRFLLLRAIRLYPAYWLAAGLVLVTRYCLWGEVPPRGWASLRNSLLLLPGASADALPLSIEWSLIYEVVFYLVFGLLALGGKRWILSGTAVWLVACLVKLFAGHGLYAPALPKWGGIALSAVNLYFLAGVVTYHLSDYGQKLRWFVPLVLPVLLDHALHWP